jgi:hypothetical protein
MLSRIGTHRSGTHRFIDTQSKGRPSEATSKRHIVEGLYSILRVPESLSHRRNWAPHPLPRERMCLPPATLLRVRRWGAQFGRLDRKPDTLWGTLSKEHIQGTCPPSDTSDKNFRSGTHRSGTHRYGIFSIIQAIVPNPVRSGHPC